MPQAPISSTKCAKPFVCATTAIEKSYVDRVRRFVVYHNKRHPSLMGGTEVKGFLSHLPLDRGVSAATQGQALAAILFLFKHVLNVNLTWIGDVVRATRPKRLPTVLIQREAQSVLVKLQGVGLGNNPILVRDGKGSKDRVTILPTSLVPHLRAHIKRVERFIERQSSSGSGELHIHEDSVQRKVKEAVRLAKLELHASCHTSGTASPHTSSSRARTSARFKN
jgi:integrase